MTTPLEHLERDLESLRAICRVEAVEGLDDARLLEATDGLSQLLRDGESLLSRVAAEVARRSPAELGKDGLAKRQGFLNPTGLIASATGGSSATASRMVSVGEATAPRRALSGEALPPRHPHVSRALSRGSVSIDAAAAITGMLDRVRLRADPARAEVVERVLAEKAAEVPLDLLRRMIREAEARLDQDGIEPREEKMRSERSLTIRHETGGMVRLQARLDPESAAPVIAAVESIVTQGIRTGRAEPVAADERTIPQRQADALTMLARHALACTRVPTAATTALVVRTDLAALVDGVGTGTIDGLDQPVSAGTIRRMAASAGVIPAVLGGGSLPLDLGRSARLFSPAQRLALGERDGGCACCGLQASYTEAHHIAWWERDAGPTDLENGVLLCPPCHARVHNDGWRIRVEKGEVWFIPPPHVDIEQKPRLGGRARFALPTEVAA